MMDLKPHLFIKTVFLLLVLLIPAVAIGQNYKGTTYSAGSNTTVGYVNVGITGKNVGTVSDKDGNFEIDLDTLYDKDTLRFSMIGYEPKSFLVRSFRESTVCQVFLKPVIYNLREVKVSYHKNKEVFLGTEVTTNELKSGFADNALGSELGIKVSTRGLVRLEDIDLNVATCTYDSVTYRLNIYRLDENEEYRNILIEPVYLTFSKDKIENAIVVDLRKYSILVEGDLLITIELFKDLGEGRLLFHTQYFTGTTYHRKTSQGKWTPSPGLIGMYLHGQLIRNSQHQDKITTGSE